MTQILHWLVDGPSREGLVDAFKYAYDEQHPHTVEFTTNDGDKLTVKVTGLVHEDGSGRSFNFQGCQIGGQLTYELTGRKDALWSRRVKGYFHVGSRSGSVIINDQTIRKVK